MTAQTDIKILRPKDIQEIYGFSRDEVYGLLKIKGCPVFPRKANKHYRVIQDEFEKWLRNYKK